MSTYRPQNGSGHDNNRDGIFRPPRIDRSRWNNNKSSHNSHSGPAQESFRQNDKGKTRDEIEGSHKRSGTDTGADTASNTRKRNRSPEPSDAPSRDEDRKIEERRGHKRAKFREEPASPSSNGESSGLTQSFSFGGDELNLGFSPDRHLEANGSATASPTSSKSKPARVRSLGVGVGVFGQTIKSMFGSPDSHRSKELQDARDAAKRHQGDLTVCQMELTRSQAELEVLKDKITMLEEEAKKNRRPETNTQNDACRELEAENRSLQRVKQELKESQAGFTKFQALSNRLNEETNELKKAASKNNRIIDDLSSQLKSLRNERKGKARDEALIDVFDHQLDQVSEARIKSGVESLNDSLDTFVMDVLEAADQLLEKYSDLVRQPPEKQHEPPSLLHSLAQHDLTPDNRGLLLDATLHDQVHTDLYEVFFSRDVASIRADPDGLLQVIFDEITQREPWTVVQRWRAIAATSLFTLFNETKYTSIPETTENVITLLAWAHGLSFSDFEPLADMIQSKLRALYQEAYDLSILARRDILSVRMTINSANTPYFDPKYANSVWPEMGAKAGDGVVGQYRFGLVKLTEAGEAGFLIKPEVATTALIRETSKT